MPPNRALPPGAWQCECGLYCLPSHPWCRSCGRPQPTLAVAAQNEPARRVRGETRPPEAVKALNRAEMRALEKARRMYPAAIIRCQAEWFPLRPLRDGDPCDVYRVDMTIEHPCASGRPAMILRVEVKGGYRGPGAEQGVERFKRARAEYPALRWELWDMSETEVTG